MRQTARVVDVAHLGLLRSLHVLLRREVLFEHDFGSLPAKLLITELAVERRFVKLPKHFFVSLRLKMAGPVVELDRDITRFATFHRLALRDILFTLLGRLPFFTIITPSMLV